MIKLMVVLGSGTHPAFSQSHRRPHPTLLAPRIGLTGCELINAFVTPGGHTAEMLALAGRLDKERYKPRCYVVGQTDSLGPAKAAAAEQSLSTHITVSLRVTLIWWSNDFSRRALSGTTQFLSHVQSASARKSVMQAGQCAAYREVERLGSLTSRLSGQHSRQAMLLLGWCGRKRLTWYAKLSPKKVPSGQF